MATLFTTQLPILYATCRTCLKACLKIELKISKPQSLKIELARYSPPPSLHNMHYYYYFDGSQQ